MRSSPRLFSLFSVFFLGCLAPSLGTAQTVEWDGEGLTDFWSDNANWDGDAQPLNSETADLGSNSVEVDDIEQAGGLILAAGGVLTMPGSGAVEIQGEVSNDGVINVRNSSGSAARFIANVAATLDGSGEVVLEDGGFPITPASIGTGGATVTHAATHTIRGEGVVSGAWNNLGTFRAEDTSGDGSAVLSFNNLPTFTNPGELRSSATGSLRFTSMNLELGATGKLVADALPIEFSGSNSVTGGTLESENGGALEHTGGILDLFGVTNEATVNVADRLRTDASGVVNNGVILIDAGETGLALLQFLEPGGELSGTGEVVLARQASSQISFSVTHPFTNGAGHTIRGAGIINHPPTNNGVIRAEALNGNVLTINNPTTNNNVLRAATGAVLRFSSTGDTEQGPAGRIEAADGGTVEFGVGFSLTGGALDTEGSGGAVVTGDNIFFEDVTNLGALEMVANSTLRLRGAAFTNDGAVTVNSDDGFAAPGPTILLENDLTLDGDGEVLLNTPAGLPAAVVDSLTNTLVHAATHTIRGEGEVFGALVNNGRLEGDSAAAPIRVFGRLTGDGALRNVQLAANLFESGVHAPGDDAAAVVPLEGSYEIAGAFNRLEIGLGGTTPGLHDQLDSSGDVVLNGVLEVDLIDGFVPSPGDTFAIIAADTSLTGGFSSTSLPTNAPNFAIDWEVHVNPNDVTIEAVTVTALPGDYNADGVVDAADFTVWREAEGASGLPAFAPGDGDGDGDVDSDDYGVWAANLGRTAASLAVAVPEPGGALSLLIVAAGTLARRVR